MPGSPKISEGTRLRAAPDKWARALSTGEERFEIRPSDDFLAAVARRDRSPA